MAQLDLDLGWTLSAAREWDHHKCHWEDPDQDLGEVWRLHTPLQTWYISQGHHPWALDIHLAQCHDRKSHDHPLDQPMLLEEVLPIDTNTSVPVVIHTSSSTGIQHELRPDPPMKTMTDKDFERRHSQTLYAHFYNFPFHLSTPPPNNWRVIWYRLNIDYWYLLVWNLLYSKLKHLALLLNLFRHSLWH